MEQNLTNKENVLQEQKSAPRLIALKIFTLLIYLATLTLLFVELLPIINCTDNSKKGWMIFGYIIAYLIIFGGIGNLLSLILSGIGLAITLKTKAKGQQRGQVIFFSIMIILPILTEIFFFLAVKLFV